MNTYLVTPSDNWAANEEVLAYEYDLIVWADTPQAAVVLAHTHTEFNKVTFEQQEDIDDDCWVVRELAKGGIEQRVIDWSECPFTFWRPTNV